MITGYNTDIEHDGIVYHVQTEDKGLATPLILSLVYTGGAILASKRVPYDDLIAEGFDEKILAERLQRQHKLICAAIRSGRLEELKSMTVRAAEARTAPPAPKEKKPSLKNELLARKPARIVAQPIEKPAEQQRNKASVPAVRKKQTARKLEPPVSSPSAPTQPLPPLPVTSSPASPTPTPPAQTPSAPVTPVPTPPAPLQTSAVPSPPEHSTPMPPPPKFPAHLSTPPVTRVPTETPPVSTPGESHMQRTATHEVVADFARSEDDSTVALRLTLLDERGYRGGERVSLRVCVMQGANQLLPVVDSEIIVKILGSTFRPQILQARTGADGIANINTQLPHFRSGRAAILIRATYGGHEAELRRIVQQG